MHVPNPSAKTILSRSFLTGYAMMLFVASGSPACGPSNQKDLPNEELPRQDGTDSQDKALSDSGPSDQALSDSGPSDQTLSDNEPSDQVLSDSLPPSDEDARLEDPEDTEEPPGEGLPSFESDAAAPEEDAGDGSSQSDASHPPLDDDVSELPPFGNTLLYLIDFEDGTLNAFIGTAGTELSAGSSGGGQITVVPNPHKDGVNRSSFVAKHSVPPGYKRAELSSQRLPTEDQTYIYKWSYYLPEGYFDGGLTWNIISQWKTWPCGKHDGYAEQICGNGGIFNEVVAHPDRFEFHYRAEPDCNNHSAAMTTGEWVSFVQEIHWTNSSNGYVKLWRNNRLIYKQENFKTLMDDFEAPRCNMYWGLGLYAESQEGLEIYTDNLQIWSR